MKILFVRRSNVQTAHLTSRRDRDRQTINRTINRTISRYGRTLAGQKSYKSNEKYSGQFFLGRTFSRTINRTINRTISRTLVMDTRRR